MKKRTIIFLNCLSLSMASVLAWHYMVTMTLQNGYFKWATFPEVIMLIVPLITIMYFNKDEK